MMRLLLLISIFIVACSTGKEEQKPSDQMAIDVADTVDLSILLGVDIQTKKTKVVKNSVARKKTVSVSALSVTPCNINVILYAYQNINNLNNDEVDAFLKNISNECENNVEFSEFNQEMIFEIFSIYPETAAKLISQNDYDLRAITKELEAPLLDPLIEPIIETIEKLNYKNPKVDSIIMALERGSQYLNN